jgi:O-antigen/teichoic acid export membrane protein
LKILLISLIFSYLSYITGALLNATNRQKAQTAILAFALLINLTMNLFLIPRYGIVGAAYSMLVSNAIICLVGFLFCDRAVELNKLALLKSAFQSMWPAVIMGLSVYYLADKIHFLIAIPIGAVIYFALSFLSGGLNMYMAKRVILKVRP